MKYTDYYATLGLDKAASEQEVRKAYRRLAKDYHPDTHPDDRVAEQKFKEINEAYEVLGHRERRLRYDQLGANWNQYQDLGDSPEPEEDPRQGRHKVEYGSQIFDLNFSDFFETFFSDQASAFWDQHGGRSEAGQAAEPPRSESEARTETGTESRPVSDPESESESESDIQYTAEITLEETLTGTRRRIQVYENDGLHTLEVRIPAGVKEGSKVRVGSQHLQLEIRLRPHPVFSPDGNNLRCSLPVMDYEAMLGTTRPVATLTGSVQMKIPAGAQAGQTFRIRGQGLPDLRTPEQRGDLLATLEIKVSKALDAEEKALIERFRALREGKK